MTDLKAVLDAALDCVVMMDHEGRIVGINPAAERVFAISDEEARGREMAEVLIPPTMRDAHRAGLARLLSGGEPHVLDPRCSSATCATSASASSPTRRCAARACSSCV